MAVARLGGTVKDSIKALRQGGKQSQIEAIHALGRLEQPGAVRALVSALDAPDADIRALAMGKLVFANSRRLVPVLLKGLEDPEPRVRQHALYALQRLKVRPAADRIARVLTADPDEMVRFNAALALAAVGGARHARAFVRAMKDRNPEVVLTAAGALRTLAPREGVRQIVRLVGEPKRWARVPEGLRDRTLRLLEDDLKDKQVLGCLRRVVHEGIRAARRQGRRLNAMELREAACLLAEAGDPVGAPVLKEMLGSVDYAQERAMKALAALKDPSAVPLIIAQPLQNVFYAIKLKAVRALGEIGDPRALPALASFFNGRTDDFPVDRSIAFTKDDPDLRVTALAAMAKIAAENLRRAAQSTDPFERTLARGVQSASRAAR